MKKKPEKKHELEIKIKKDVHNEIMLEKVEKVWELDTGIYYSRCAGFFPQLDFSGTN